MSSLTGPVLDSLPSGLSCPIRSVLPDKSSRLCSACRRVRRGLKPPWPHLILIYWGSIISIELHHECLVTDQQLGSRRTSLPPVSPRVTQDHDAPPLRSLMSPILVLALPPSPCFPVFGVFSPDTCGLEVARTIETGFPRSRLQDINAQPEPRVANKSQQFGSADGTPVSLARGRL